MIKIKPETNKVLKMSLLLFALFFSLTLHAHEKYINFINTQLDLVYQINENNTTQENIEEILKKQNRLYEVALNKMMSSKDAFIGELNLYENEIFSIKKIIAINKREGNNSAVLRDEVALKTYLVMKEQSNMIRNVLLALDSETLDEYKTKLSEEVEKNRLAMQEIYAQDYHSYLISKNSSSKILNAIEENVRKFYALYEVNIDIINNLYKYENKMYSLNKYSKYNLTSFVLFVNSTELVQTLDPILYEYGLSVIKLIFIFFLILVIYIFRKIVYVMLESYILRIDFFKKYSQQILAVLRRPLEYLIILINIHMILYVYNSFSINDSFSRVFDMAYGFIFTFIVYKVVNTIAAIKLSDINNINAKMKNDFVNVSLKILNFIIIVIGILIMLYYAGVDLTTVLSGLGIGSLAVAFAAKDTIANFFGTLSILVSDIFSQGDWVEVNSKEGVVVEIGLRVTTLRTFDNALISIPNGTLANADIKNWNKRTLGRRIKMDIGVKYDSKSQDIKNAVNQIREMLEKHPGIATKDTKHAHFSSDMAKLVSKDDLEGVKKTLLVNLDSFAASSINIMIYCFSKSVVWNEWLDTKEDVMHKIMEILEKNSLEFAFPSLSVYNEKME